MEETMYWYNFRTEEYEQRRMPTDFEDYIPQYPAAISLYRLLVQHERMPPVDAAEQVLKACVGNAEAHG